LETEILHTAAHFRLQGDSPSDRGASTGTEISF